MFLKCFLSSQTNISKPISKIIHISRSEYLFNNESVTAQMIMFWSRVPQEAFMKIIYQKPYLFWNTVLDDPLLQLYVPQTRPVLSLLVAPAESLEKSHNVIRLPCYKELLWENCYSTFWPLKCDARAEVAEAMSGCVSLVVESQTKPEKKIRIKNKFLSCQNNCMKNSAPGRNGMDGRMLNT